MENNDPKPGTEEFKKRFAQVNYFFGQNTHNSDRLNLNPTLKWSHLMSKEERIKLKAERKRLFDAYKRHKVEKVKEKRKLAELEDLKEKEKNKEFKWEFNVAANNNNNNNVPKLTPAITDWTQRMSRSMFIEKAHRIAEKYGSPGNRFDPFIMRMINYIQHDSPMYAFQWDRDRLRKAINRLAKFRANGADYSEDQLLRWENDYKAKIEITELAMIEMGYDIHADEDDLFW